MADITGTAREYLESHEAAEKVCRWKPNSEVLRVDVNEDASADEVVGMIAVVMEKGYKLEDANASHSHINPKLRFVPEEKDGL